MQTQREPIEGAGSRPTGAAPRSKDARDERRLAFLERTGESLTAASDRRSLDRALSNLASELISDFAEGVAIFAHTAEAVRLAGCAHRALERAELERRLKKRGLFRALRGWFDQRYCGVVLADGLTGSIEPAPPAAQEPGRLLREGLDAEALLLAPFTAGPQCQGGLAVALRSGADAEIAPLWPWVKLIARVCSGAIAHVESLLELRADMAKQQLLVSMLSHDLKSPLSAITLSTGALTPAPSVHDRRRSRRQVDVIYRSAEHMSSVIENIQLESQLASGTFELSRRAEAVDELVADCCRVARPLCEMRRTSLEIEVPCGLPKIDADKDRLRRALSNLLAYAIQHTAAGGEIQLSAVCAGPEVELRVCGVGCALSDDQAQSLFELQAAGSAGPHALGLRIARAVVEAHGGSLRVDNGDDPRRSTFVLSLPAAAQ